MYNISLGNLGISDFSWNFLGIIAEIQLKVFYITSIQLKIYDFVANVILFNDDVVTLVLHCFAS